MNTKKSYVETGSIIYDENDIENENAIILESIIAKLKRNQLKLLKNSMPYVDIVKEKTTAIEKENKKCLKRIIRDLRTINSK